VFNPRLINKTYRLEPPIKKEDEKRSYDLKISAKEFLAKQRIAAKIELQKKEILNETMVKKLAVVTPRGQPVPETIDIKTSKLLNVIEKEKYDNLQDMIDVVDYDARMKIKKADWFINPEHSLSMRKRMFLEKSLCYSKNVLN
jgi:hypothetical protein